MNNLPSTTRWPKSRLLIWTKRILLGLFLALVAFWVIGATYQAIGARADKRNFPPPGQLVDVGGYQMHIFCQGEGSPTIILESLAGGMSSHWGWVQPELARHTRACAYDWAGRAWSQPRPFKAEDHARQTILELHTLLERAGISDSYILVGHSIGGIIVRLYTARYPEEVTGIVLLDSAHPEQFQRAPELLDQTRAFQRQLAFFPFFAQVGLFRLYFATGEELDFQDLPDRQHDETAAFWSSPQYHYSLINEIEDNIQFFDQGQELAGLGDLPLMVVTASETGPFPLWPELQSELAALSSNSLHITVPGATHTSLVFNQMDAHETSSAILQIVDAARTGQPLASK